MLHILIQNQYIFLHGFLTTVQLLGCIILIGIPVGILLGIVGGRYSAGVAYTIKGFRFVTKVIPVLVLLFWLHYPLQAFLGIVVNPFWTAAFVLGLINMSATANVVTVELELLPRAYREAGITLGMSKGEVIRHIELPLLFRRIIPQLLLNQTLMLEYTLFASLISVPELFRVAQTVNSMIYKPVEIYSLLVVFFFIILAPLHWLISWLQKKYATKYA